MSNPQAPSVALALNEIEAFAQEHDLVYRHDDRDACGAVFSPCGKYRYLLWRAYARDLARPFIGFGMLNPSTADHRKDDPTIRRLRDRTFNQLRGGGLLVWNLFALRTPHPAELRLADFPVGPVNNKVIDLALQLCHRTILGWGVHGTHQQRDLAVLARAGALRAEVEALAFTKDGYPRHPLYLKKDLEPVTWTHPFA